MAKRTRQCPSCGQKFHPRGIGTHKAFCKSARAQAAALDADLRPARETARLASFTPLYIEILRSVKRYLALARTDLAEQAIDALIDELRTQGEA
jgi:hypothetical protein